MRRGMRDGHPAPFCERCGLMELHPPDFEPPDLPLVPDTYPRVLYVEPTIICNLRCPQPACVPEEVYDTRSDRMLSFDLYKKVLYELGPHLERMVFYNYGESFIHKDAFQMIRYAKDVNPKIWIWTSTNGHYFDKPEKVRALVDSGIDEIQFSIDGATQEVYEQYRKRGRWTRFWMGSGPWSRSANAVARPGPGSSGTTSCSDGTTPMRRWSALVRWRSSWASTASRGRRPTSRSACPSTRFVPGTPDYERIRPGLLGGGRDTPSAVQCACRDRGG